MEEKLKEPNRSFDARKLYEHYGETVVLAPRTDNTFIEIFASPGAIVEDLGTMCKILQHCSSRCRVLLFTDCRSRSGSLPEVLDKSR